MTQTGYSKLEKGVSNISFKKLGTIAAESYLTTTELCLFMLFFLSSCPDQ